MNRTSSAPKATPAARRSGSPARPGGGGSAGFTLTELTLVIVIAGVLATMGVPSMTSMLQNNRRATELNRFVAALNIARGEAIKRRTVVSVCESATGTSCSTTGAWENGWIVFVNNDGDDPAVVDAGEPVLKVFAALDGGLTLRGSGDFVNAVSYHSRGFTQPPGAASTGGALTICDERGKSKARAVLIASTGRPRLSTDTDSDGVEEDAAGNDLGCP